MSDLFPAWSCARFEVSDSLDCELQRAFPSLNLIAEYENSASYLAQNPGKTKDYCKTYRGVRRYLFWWCRRANSNLGKQALVQAEIMVGAGPAIGIGGR